MLEHGLWMRTRGQKPAHIHRRPRKEHFGELVQLDGSFHCWFVLGIAAHQVRPAAFPALVPHRHIPFQIRSLWFQRHDIMVL